MQPAPPDLAPVLAANVFFANGPAAVLDDRPISIVDGLEPPEGGVVIWIRPPDPNSFVRDMVEDDSGYPLIPDLSPASGSDNRATVTSRADGISLSVDAFYGAGISEEDRNEANDIATSLTVPPAPAPPPEGSATARFPDRPDIQAWRLGPADRFQPGTVVEVSIEPVPDVEQQRSLFIVTPDQPINEAEHWMISGSRSTVPSPHTDVERQGFSVRRSVFQRQRNADRRPRLWAHAVIGRANVGRPADHRLQRRSVDELTCLKSRDRASSSTYGAPGRYLPEGGQPDVDPDPRA